MTTPSFGLLTPTPQTTAPVQAPAVAGYANGVTGAAATPATPSVPGQPNPSPGVAPFVPGSAQDIAQMQQYYANQVKQQIALKGADHADLMGAIMTPLEWVGSKAYWTYSNLVARPITTALIAGQHADTNTGGLFDSSTWSNSWAEAKNVSPGQALYVDAHGFFDDAWEKNFLMSGNKDHSLIWDHPDMVKGLFGSGDQRVVSGGMDAVISWEGDPLKLGGRGLGVLKDAAYVKPVVQTANETFAGSVTKLGIGAYGKLTGATPDAVQAAQAAWGARLTTNNFNKALQSSAYSKFGDYIMDNKSRLGDQFSGWAATQKWAQQSAMAGTIAHALGNATDRGEVDAVLATAMGSTEAIPTLIDKNAELGSSILNAMKNKSDWYENVAGVNLGRLASDDPIASQYMNQMQSYADQFNAVNAQTQRLSHAMDLQNQLKSGLYFNSLISPTAAKLGQAASAAFHYGESAGLLYNNLFLRPVRLYQAVGNTWSAIRPNGWIKMDDPNSYRELDAQLKNSGVWTDAERQTHVSNYINATYGAKRNMLTTIESQTLGAMAKKYGMSDDGAKALYNEFTDQRARAFSSPQYSAATIDLGNGTKVNVAQVDHDGGLSAVHPLLQTQLENEHPIMDFTKMNSILKLNGSSFQKLIDEGREYADAANAAQQLGNRAGFMGKMTWSMQKSKDAYNSFSDIFNHVWKFNAHFRLGYGPRQLADEWLSQAARLNSVNLLSNALHGMKFNEPTTALGRAVRAGYDLRPNWMYDTIGYNQKVLGFKTQIQALQQEINESQRLQGIAKAIKPQTNRGLALQAGIVQRHQGLIDDNMDRLDASYAQLSAVTNSRKNLVNQRIILPGGQVVNAFGDGPEGRLAVDLNSGRQSIESALGGSAAITLNGLRNGLGRKTYYWNDTQHLGAWLKNVQYQIGHDAAAMQVVNGKNTDQLANWLKNDKQGKAYYRSTGIKNWTEEEQADRIVAHVNHTLPQLNPEFSAVRDAVGRGASDSEVASLMRKTQAGYRPAVNEADYSIASGRDSSMQKIDKIISGWYEKLGNTPVNVLSRNPLAATLYRRHVQEIMSNWEAQGITHVSNDDLDRIAQQARSLAIRDVKKYTYNMDYETKLSYMSRFVSPFFGAGQEAINRWGRILAEKPDTLGKMAYLYDTPMKMGITYTYDGRPVVDGYTVDPTTGKRVLVPMDQTMIRFQVPDFMVSGINAVLGNALQKGSSAEIPLSSLALPFRNKPWFNPGEGPLVQAAFNDIALKSSPQWGDLFTRLGILPVGVQNKSLMQQLMGSTFQSIQDSQDDGTQQAMALQAMEQETWRYQNGMRSTAPTWDEIQKRASNMADLKAWFHGSTLLPFSVDFQDPYQFYRDQYKSLMNADPTTADQQFMSKYGSSAFAFTASLNKNNVPGVPATANGQLLYQRYQHLIDQDPELAGIIIGDSGAGNFSQSAYAQQVASGQRVKMTAQEAWNQEQANLGWAIYKSYMSGLNAQLFQRGLTTMNSKGAEDLLAQKVALVKMMGSPTLADGKTANQYYNEQWTQAYNSFDPSADNRKALAMQQIATAKELQGRPDIAGLQQYLSLRASVQAIMAERANQKIPKTMSQALTSMYGDINTKANADLKDQFQQAVMQLIEQSPAFQTLHDRYLSKDMFDHYDGTNMTNSITGQQ